VGHERESNATVLNDVAKDFMKYFMQPKVMNENLKAGLGRWAPAIPQIVKDDPWWFSDEMPV
jgi:hypothetical protein